MGKKIILTETQEQQLLEYLIVEQRFTINPQDVLMVKEFLDKNFKKGNLEEFKNGTPGVTPVVGRLLNGKVVQNLNARQLFDVLEDEFRGLYGDKIHRSKFLARVIQDWYANKISKEGLLSTTYC